MRAKHMADEKPDEVTELKTRIAELEKRWGIEQKDQRTPRQKRDEKLVKRKRH